jgi:NADH-quinone oxidoreductase subunit J
LDLSNILFYILAAMALFSALAVVAVQNPIYSALFLASTMLAVAGLFFTLQAYFIAGVQLIVYAGAVLVLFVMVIMLFDLRKEHEGEGGNMPFSLFKALAAGAVLGLLVGGFEIARAIMQDGGSKFSGVAALKEVSIQLFTKNLFAFEIISVLLLLVVVGALSLAKSRGGTHA